LTSTLLTALLANPSDHAGFDEATDIGSTADGGAAEPMGTSATATGGASVQVSAPPWKGAWKLPAHPIDLDPGKNPKGSSHTVAVVLATNTELRRLFTDSARVKQELAKLWELFALHVLSFA
jgi:hypothetical protein